MNDECLQYVPVLKVKRGEKRALSLLPMAARQRVLPVLDVVENAEGKDLDKHLGTAFKGLPTSLVGFPRCFIDAREIENDDPRATEKVLRRAQMEGMRVSPVTGITRTNGVSAVLANSTHGLGLRLLRTEFESGTLVRRLKDFMGRHGLTPESVDLIVDLGAVADMIAYGVSALTRAFVADIPDIARWRTVSIVACAFPMSMGGIARHAHKQVDRSEWLSWRDFIHPSQSTRGRRLIFGDYVIQHPAGVENFDPRIMQVSATIRYAVHDAWILIKGESTRVVRARDQFPVLATRLVYGRLQSQYQGAAHCPGCCAMKAAADGATGFGSPEAWRRLGTIHHICQTLDALDAL